MSENLGEVAGGKDSAAEVCRGENGAAQQCILHDLRVFA
jgi:hypothetical protein